MGTISWHCSSSYVVICGSGSASFIAFSTPNRDRGLSPVELPETAFGQVEGSVALYLDQCGLLLRIGNL
jgi:hypothetical protein